MPEHFTKENEGRVGAVVTEEDAAKAHHLATADPDFEEPMTGPAHERKYGLEREEESKANWEANGVHPYENGRLETTDGKRGAENADAPKAKRA